MTERHIGGGGETHHLLEFEKRIILIFIFFAFLHPAVRIYIYIFLSNLIPIDIRCGSSCTARPHATVV